MSDPKFFPSDNCEALALLYLQTQDVAKMTPEELTDKYHEVLRRIREQNPKSIIANKKH